MKRTSKGPVRRIRLRAVVAYPAVSLALVAAVALVVTPFGPSQGVALAAAAIPIETATVTATTTDPPTPTASATTDPTPTDTTSLTPSPSSATVAAVGAAPGDHHVIARIEGPQLQANYLPVDQPVVDGAQFQTFRVRFRLHNAGPDPITTTPQLEYRPELGSSYAVVPEQPTANIPFHVAREWIPSPSLAGGTVQSALGEDILPASFRIGDEPGLAVTGHHSMGANPDSSITLPAASYTEEEFTVALSVDAKYLTGYELRITDGTNPLTGTDVATIRLGAAPEVALSPGQHLGVEVVDPAPATSAAGAAYPLVLTTSVSAAPAVSRPSSSIYPLTTTALSAATFPTDIHGPYDLASGQCAICHSGHAAQAPNLSVKPGSQSTVCFMCHDGTTANANVRAEYYPLVPLTPNDSGKREYYSHDAVGPAPATPHTRSDLNEFGGVTNRHSECADCHNSHKARTIDGSETSAGWTASGRLAGVSGVSVVNSPTPGAAPAYTFLSGVDDAAAAADGDPVTDVNAITLEYQLCFKCHSGFTTLPLPIAGKPSTDALDKAVEFNPANASFHPIEAPGKNGTAAMTASLHGTSPYKLWNFNTTSTVRCLNCHAAGPADPAAVPDPLPLPGAAFAPHASSNRGILLQTYRDRVLKSTTDAYSAGDFALCYVCHAEAPFAPNGTASAATNFSLHSKHLTGLALKGDGVTDIDAVGAGQGNAICAECHFRIHSTTNKVGTQAIDGSRLVNFAPNVQPDATGGTISWTPGATSGGSCTLTCHGYTHKSAPY